MERRCYCVRISGDFLGRQQRRIDALQLQCTGNSSRAEWLWGQPIMVSSSICMPSVSPLRSPHVAEFPHLNAGARCRNAGAAAGIAATAAMAYTKAV